MMSRRPRVKGTPQPRNVDEPCYQPVSYAWQTRQCKRLNIPFVRLIELCSPSGPQCLRVRVPSRILETDGDGNCLFRCFSLAITGSDVHHALVRKLIVDHISRNWRAFSAFFPESLQDNPEIYLSKTKMAHVGTWGSDVEIMAAAHLLKTRIFVYTIHGDNWQWVEHNLDLTAPESKMYNESIYLMHTGLVHYDLVEEVEPRQHYNQEYEVRLKSQRDARSGTRGIARTQCPNKDTTRQLKPKSVKSALENTNNCYGDIAFALAIDEFAFAKWLLKRQKAHASKHRRRRFLSSEK